MDNPTDYTLPRTLEGLRHLALRSSLPQNTNLGSDAERIHQFRIESPPLAFLMVIPDDASDTTKGSPAQNAIEAFDNVAAGMMTTLRFATCTLSAAKTAFADAIRDGYLHLPDAFTKDEPVTTHSRIHGISFFYDYMTFRYR